MAVRARMLLPDIAINTAFGQMDAVSREALVETVVEAVALQELAGGVISVAVQRQPTGVPNEMVTVSAMVEWRDRTDAKAQPEPAANPETEGLARVASAPEIHEIEVEVDALQPETAPEPAGAALPFAHDGDDLPPINDGIDDAALPEEDDSAVQAELAR